MKWYVFVAIFAIISLLSYSAALVYSAESALVGGDRPVQTIAPDGTQTGTLAVTSSTVDMSNYVLYSIYSASGTCFFRLMPTSAKSTYVAAPIPNTTWVTFAKNPTTPFLNLSGCVNGRLLKQ